MTYTFLKHIFFIVTKVKADIKTDHTHTQQHPDRNTEEFSRTGVRFFPHGLSRENETLSPHINNLARMTLYPFHTIITPEAVTHLNQT